jgi:3-methyladenine DNA glycosylase/8-oxoguanine DNA glycosylase
VFEAVVAAVASQNVHFSRTYQVMDRLTRRFGQPVPYPGGIAYTFPTVEVLAHSAEDDLRSSGLGYRAPVLRALARTIFDEGVDLQRLRQVPDTASIRDALMELPGVGPFTADLVLSIGFRRASFHLDSYTKTILEVLYGVEPDETTMKDFVDKQFGRWKHYAMLLLTTDTDRWAPSLGTDFPIKSGASYRAPSG